jgi:hypothetical protein
MTKSIKKTDELAATSTTNYTINAASAVGQLIESHTMSGDAKDYKVSGLGALLAALQGAELEGNNVNFIKRAVFADNGWTYKTYDANSESMMVVEGDKAPANIATAFSEAKRAFIQFGSLKDFGTWEEMRKRCKPIDPMLDIKALQKSINRTVKALNSVDWNDYAHGALEKLDAELARVDPARRPANG